MRRKAILAFVLAFALAAGPISNGVIAAANDPGAEAEAEISSSTEDTGGDFGEVEEGQNRNPESEEASMFDAANGDSIEAPVTTPVDMYDSEENAGKIQMPVPTGLKWDGMKAMWDAVPGGEEYCIEVYKDGELLQKIYACINEILIQGGDGEDGIYKFRVMARAVSTDYVDSDYSEFSEEIEVRRIHLQIPSGLKWNGCEAIWDAVPDADRYQIEFYKGTEYYDGGISSWNHSELSGATNGTYKFRIRALPPSGSAEYCASEWSEFSEELEINRSQLPSPTGLKWESWEGTSVISVSWDAVPEAARYTIEVYQNGSYRRGYRSKTPTVYLTPFDEGILNYWGRSIDGIYKFRVKAEADGNSVSHIDSEWSEFSEEKEIKRELLAVPVVEWDGAKAVWDAVPGAKYYEVQFRYFSDPGYSGSTTSTSDTSWELGGGTRNGDYELRVRVSPAYGFSDPNYCEYSEIISVKLQRNPLPTPTGLKWDGNKATWDAVPGADGYQILVHKDGRELSRDFVGEVTECDLSSRLVENGTYKFSVEASAPKASAEYCSSEMSEFSEEKVVSDGKKTFAAPTGLRWEGNWHAVWDPVPEAEGYYEIWVYKDGLLYWKGGGGREFYPDHPESTPYSTYTFDEGVYTFQVRAYAGTEEKKEEYTTLGDFSQFSEGRRYVKPDKTLGTTVGHWSDTEIGKLQFESVENAAAYQFQLFYRNNVDAEEKILEWITPDPIPDGYKEEAEVRHEEDFSQYIKENGAGLYRVKIRALSGNIDEIANGDFEESEYSDYLDTTEAELSPSAKPTAEPTGKPTTEPTAEPTTGPTAEPTTSPTTEPTAIPTTSPTTEPTAAPTTAPTTEPTAAPTTEPTPALPVTTTEPPATTTESPSPTAAPPTNPTVTPTQPPNPDTQVPFIKGEAGKEGWEAIKEDASNAFEGKWVNVDMNGSSVVPGHVLDSIKGQNVTLSFDLGNGVIWFVNGTSVTAEYANDVDFSLQVWTSNIPRNLVESVAGNRQTVQISLAYDGYFGYNAVLMIDLGKANAGLNATLFYYNESAGTLEAVTVDQINENGIAELVFSHASDYVIVLGDEETDVSSNGTSSGSNSCDLQGTGVRSPKTGELDIVIGGADSAELQNEGNSLNLMWLFLIGAAVIAVTGTITFLVYKKVNK